MPKPRALILTGQGLSPLLGACIITIRQFYSLLFSTLSLFQVLFCVLFPQLWPFAFAWKSLQSNGADIL